MTDTRSDATGVLGPLQLSSWRALLKLVACIAVALVAALLPENAGLSDAGRWALFILILAAGLWISEAIPAFAVGLLVIGLEIAILGRPGGVVAEDSKDWERFIEIWGSPLIWLFFGGFVLASAAMCLPISTPPNAIAYGTGRLKALDLFQVGIFIGLLAPIVVTAWCLLVLPL